jgi:hypothetical protein
VIESQRLPSESVLHATVVRHASTLADRNSSALQPLCSAATRLASGSILVFEWDATDARGRLVARELVPVSVWLSREQNFDPLRTRALIELLADSPRIRRVVQGEVDRRCAHQFRVLADAAVHIERRLTALLARANRARPSGFQASLFDRRAEQQTRAAEAANASWRNHLERRILAARALASLTASPARLIAAWPS